MQQVQLNSRRGKNERLWVSDVKVRHYIAYLMCNGAQEGMGGCGRLRDGVGGGKIVQQAQLNGGRGKNEVVGQRCQSPMLRGLPKVRRSAGGCGRACEGAKWRSRCR
jgi:hypothetical protein